MGLRVVGLPGLRVRRAKHSSRTGRKLPLKVIPSPQRGGGQCEAMKDQASQLTMTSVMSRTAPFRYRKYCGTARRRQHGTAPVNCRETSEASANDGLGHLDTACACASLPSFQLSLLQQRHVLPMAVMLQASIIISWKTKQTDMTNGCQGAHLLR